MDVGFIEPQALNKLKKVFQKDINSMLEWYLADSEKKLLALEIALDKNNHKQIITLLKEIRLMSVDIGAISFSFLCLSAELVLVEHPACPHTQLAMRLKAAHAQVKRSLVQMQQPLTLRNRPSANLAQCVNGL